MSKANKLNHTAKLDIKEVCEYHNNYKTHDKVYIRKILVANIDPTTPYKLLYKTFAKFGQITSCILKKQKQFEKLEVNPTSEGNEEENGEGNQEENQMRNQEENEMRNQEENEMRNQEENEMRNQEENEMRNQEENQMRNQEKIKSNVIKSYAFITYYTHLEAHRALEAGKNRKISIKKQYLRVVPANSWHQPDNQDAFNKFCYVSKHRASEIPPDAELPEHYFFRVEDGAPINQLNNDCLRHIFNFLPFFDRVRVERVSQRWKAVSEEAWHDQHKLDFDPVNWGYKSLSKIKPRILRNIDSCSAYKIFKRCCPFIAHIDLSKFSCQLGNSILIELADMCSLIEHINLDNFTFRHTGIKALAANCMNLKSISLGYVDCNYKFDKELSLLFSRNRVLEKVELDCFLTEGKCLYHLPKQCMQELTLKNANYVLKNGIFKFIRKMPNLRILKIIGIPGEFRKYGDFIKCISSCSKLEVLEIPSNQRSDTSYLNSNTLEPLTHLNNLAKINLKGNCILNDNFLLHLSANCRNLKSIDISDCPNIRDPGLDSITSLPKLEYLCIEKLANVTDGVFMKRMPNIKILLCSDCANFHSFGFSMMIESANKLELLDVTNCTHLGNDFVIDVIRKCKRTRRIRSKCLKIYLGGTKARLTGINLRHFWNYLQLMDEDRPSESPKNESNFFY